MKPTGAFVVAALLFAARVGAQTTPVFDSSAQGGTDGAASVSTSTTLTTGGGPNQDPLCGIATGRDDGVFPTATGVTFGAATLNFRSASEYSNGAYTAHVELWDLTGVPTATNGVTATLSMSTPATIGCVLYNYVNQSTPTGTLVTNSGRTGGTTVTVGSSATGVVVDVAAVNFQIEAVKTATVGSGQTQLVQELSAAASNPPAVLLSREDGAASVMMDWTFDAATNLSWGAIGVPLLFEGGGDPNFAIEAEDYNAGGEGVGYHDTVAGNSLGSAYRGDDVDLYDDVAASNGVVLGDTMAGEWLKYDQTVLTTGNYVLTFVVASGTAGGVFHLDMDGIDVTGPLTMPNTGSYVTLTPAVTHNATLTAGAHTFQLTMDTNNGGEGVVGNFDSWSATYSPIAPGGGGGVKLLLLGIGGNP